MNAQGNMPVIDEQDTGNEAGRGRRLLAVGAVALIAAGAAFGWWYTTRNLVSTDDAYIQADIVTISPRVSGTVKTVSVAENQAVKEGDVLVVLDPVDYQVRVEQAKANLEAAKAALASAQADLALTRDRSSAGVSQAEAAVRSAKAEAQRANADVERYRALYAKDEVSKQQLDAAEAATHSLDARLDQSVSALRDAQTAPRQVTLKGTVVSAREAEVAQAQAEWQQAELNLSYTRILAPRDGKVSRKNVLPGMQVPVGTPLLAIVSDEPWVVANFKETQVAGMQPGQPVQFKVDAYPGYKFTGYVDSVQSGTGSVFSLLPPENATGNFVKVVQRVPVKLVFDPKPDAQHRLVPGMSVVPTVDLAGEPRQVPVAAKP